MSLFGFERETLFDLIVTVIPIGFISFCRRLHRHLRFSYRTDGDDGPVLAARSVVPRIDNFHLVH